MPVITYPPRVKTIDAIRMENYERLLGQVREKLKAEHDREPKDYEIADALGITKEYFSQIKNRKRVNLEEDAARRIEVKLDLERGLMDNDTSLWPFQTIRADRFAKLPERQKGMAEQEVRRILEEWEDSLGGAAQGHG